MTESPPKLDGDGCDICGEAEGDLRPVMTELFDDPILLCDQCFRRLDAYNQIDRQADKEEFGYA